MSTYTLPERDPYTDWAGYKARGFTPNARQRIAMDSVQRALDAGLYYNTDVRAFCAKDLAISPDVDACKRSRTEGGTFGYDLYYARGTLDAIRVHLAEDEAARELALEPGKVLGTLMFNDYKLVHRVTITEVHAGGLVAKFTGSRGKGRVHGECTALQLKYAMQRKRERDERKQGARA